MSNLEQMGLCDKKKAELMLEDSWLLESVEVTFKQGQSVFDVLKTPDIQRISGVLSSRYEKCGFAPQEKIEWLVFSCISLK